MCLECDVHCFKNKNLFAQSNREPKLHLMRIQSDLLFYSKNIYNLLVVCNVLVANTVWIANKIITAAKYLMTRKIVE